MSNELFYIIIITQENHFTISTGNEGVSQSKYRDLFLIESSLCECSKKPLDITRNDSKQWDRISRNGLNIKFGKNEKIFWTL